MSDRARHQTEAAVFIDAENHPDLHISNLLQRLDYLNIAERHAYADWRYRRLERLAERLERTGFEMHHTWSGRRYGSLKNKADGRMLRDILRIVARRPEIKAVIIVSGDVFFTRVACQLQQQGRQVIVAADPLRTSKELRGVADEYLPVGKLEGWVRGLDRLERTSEYLTFRFVVQKLGLEPSDLAKLIHRGLVVQKKVRLPKRGFRREIHLNRQAFAVQVALGPVV